ncbi:MAG: hypothetical protein NTV51_09345 [Verrucomicrobia bacterium]|nr:hypothetical protein [Verrucomicrobiota bacterium]
MSRRHSKAVKYDHDEHLRTSLAIAAIMAVVLFVGLFFIVRELAG